MNLPKGAGVFGKIAAALKSNKPDVARALPDSKGGETPKSLETYRTQAYTYFTKASTETQLLYSAENWVHITLGLQTAGPVAIGTSADIVPVLSGRGIVLDPDDEPVKMYLAKGTRVYITSQTINRVDVVIEPVPWMEQFDGDMRSGFTGVIKTLGVMTETIVAALNALRTGQPMPSADQATPIGAKKPPPTPNNLPPPGELRLPRVASGGLPRMTGIVPPSKIRP